MKAEGVLPTVGSKFDQLTSLYNREAFFREVALILGARYDVNYCIVCMDISCFKIINDLFHMDTGNLILRTAADYL
ncbi:MAG: diguanylate cyclase, partial [Selenomonadaceae bacterium]|nr:diguanylate cyclase [Selenomonadaceae bacterium]